jgi:hypothetical protein
MKYVCNQIVCNASVIRLLDAGNDIASNRSDLMCLSPPSLRRLARDVSFRPDHSPGGLYIMTCVNRADLFLPYCVRSVKATCQ